MQPRLNPDRHTRAINPLFSCFMMFSVNNSHFEEVQLYVFIYSDNHQQRILFLRFKRTLPRKFMEGRLIKYNVIYFHSLSQSLCVPDLYLCINLYVYLQSSNLMALIPKGETKIQELIKALTSIQMIRAFCHQLLCRKPGLLWMWGLLWTDFAKIFSDALKYF